MLPLSARNFVVVIFNDLSDFQPNARRQGVVIARHLLKDSLAHLVGESLYVELNIFGMNKWAYIRTLVAPLRKSICFGTWLSCIFLYTSDAHSPARGGHPGSI